MAYDPVQNPLAIGTSTGSLRMYPLHILFLSEEIMGPDIDVME